MPLGLFPEILFGQISDQVETGLKQMEHKKQNFHKTKFPTCLPKRRDPKHPNPFLKT